MEIQEYIGNLNWRYAVKKFDVSKKISENDLNCLLEAARLSPSSYGLQPYQIYVIQDPGLREQLQKAAYDQKQVTEASHLIVLANKTDFGAELVDDYLENVGETRNLASETLNPFGDQMKTKLGTLSEQEKKSWTAKQTYIALGNLLSAAAAMKIDSCPMEGFNVTDFNTLLGLEEKGLGASVLIALGYRSDLDRSKHYKKVRKSKEDLVIHI